MPMTRGKKRTAKGAYGKVRFERESARATSARKKKETMRKVATRGRYSFRKVHRRTPERKEREDKRARNQNGWGETVNKGERGHKRDSKYII